MDKRLLFYAVLSVIAINNVLGSNNSACEKGTLSCDDGRQCVMSEKWCDKKFDCEDKSDEALCQTVHWYTSYDPNNCPNDTHFLCSSGICVPKHARCNGHDDCRDYSDEVRCEEESSTEIIITTEKLENVEDSIDSERETSESAEDSDDYIPSERQDSEDEISLSKPNKLMQPPSSTESSSISYSNTQDYYGKRMKETDAPEPDVSSQTSSSSSTRSRTPATTPFPHVTPSDSYTRTASPEYPPQRQTTRHNYQPQTTTHDYQRQTTRHDYQRQTARPDYQPQTARHDYPRQTTRPDYQPQTARHDYQPQTARTYYPHQSQTDNQREQTVERRPYPPNRSSQSYYPQIHDSRPPTYDTQQHIYDRRKEDYDRRQQPYDTRSQILNNHAQNHYSQSRPHDSQASIFSNRIPRPRYNQPSTVNKNVLNGEPDWREIASLKPYSGLTEIIKPLYLAKDYAEVYGRSNIRSVREGENWLLNQRNEDGDWDKDTARALVALALTNNSFPSGKSDYELMKRRFLVQLSVALLRNSSNKLQLSRLAMAMNALFAVCENPWDFHSLDLAELLRIRIRETARNRGYPNPFVYLSLCLSGKSLTDSEVQYLMRKMHASATEDEMPKDTQSLAIQAFSCYMHQVSSLDQAYRMSLQERLNNAVSDLLSRMGEDGSFGSIYSTALAAQALLSVNDSRGWNSQKTVNFLKQQQQEDGSFGDLLATYYTLPALSGRSLLHLRNIQCTPAPVPRELTPTEILQFVGPKQFIHYSIYFGYPLVSSHSIRVQVPEGINFLDVMRVAEHQNRNFRFLYETGDKNLNVYSLSGTPSDIEQGLSWHLYVKDEANPNQKELRTTEQYNRDLKEFFPTANTHMIFWYHPIGLRN